MGHTASVQTPETLSSAHGDGITVTGTSEQSTVIEQAKRTLRYGRTQG
jgi:hypothetical protein